MSARRRFVYDFRDERQRLAHGVGTSSPPRRPTRPGGVLGRGGRRVPRRRSPLGAALGRRVSQGGWGGPGRPPSGGPAAEVDPRPGEGDPPLVGRQADRARLPDRSVDRPEGGPLDPPGVRHRDQPEVHHRLASPTRVHPAEAPAGPSPARPGGDRRVVGRRLAAHQKKARRQHAHIALIDESGLLMAPLVRRTWAPRGQTPDFVQSGGRGPREKVSVAAALWLSPRRDRLGLYSKTLVNGYFDNWYVTAFLEAMLRDLEGRVVVVWDGGPMHKGDPIRRLADHFAGRLCLEALPPWAPMLNPTEPLWAWLKYDRLCNYAPHDAAELDGRVMAELATAASDQEFMRSLYHASELPIPRTLLS